MVRDVARAVVEKTLDTWPEVFSSSPSPQKPNVNRDVLNETVYRLLDDCFPPPPLKVVATAHDHLAIQLGSVMSVHTSSAMQVPPYKHRHECDNCRKASWHCPQHVSVVSVHSTIISMDCCSRIISHDTNGKCCILHNDISNLCTLTAIKPESDRKLYSD